VLSILSYRVVVPGVDQPELIVFELGGGRYQHVVHVTGGQPFRAERPLPVEVVPARLVVGLLPDCQQAAARRGAKRVTRSAS
jgi:hypothetical protein